MRWSSTARSSFECLQASRAQGVFALRANSLRIGTGNFLRPCGEFNQAIREISALIRECCSRPLFWGEHGPADKSDAPERSRTFPAKASGRREMLEVADAYLKLEVGQCSCERRPWTAGNRSLRLSTRAIGIAGLARVRRRQLLGQ